VSTQDTDEFRSVFIRVLNECKPPAVAHLRAIVCSYAVPGAPPLPESVLKELPALVQLDAGDDAVMALFNETMKAYYIEAPAPSAQPN
jgi:hypothetical protein